MRVLGDYKKINLSYSLEDRATQVLYRQVFNEAGELCQVPVRSFAQTFLDDDELKLHISDNLESIRPLIGKKNYFFLYHIDGQNFVPGFEIFFPDMVCFTIPRPKAALKLLSQSVKAKNSKISMVRQLTQYKVAVEDKIFDIAENISKDLFNGSDQKTGMAHYLDGLVAKRKGELEQAFDSFVLAFETKPDHPLYLYELAMLVYEHGQRDDALILCAKFAQSFPLCLPILKAGLELSIKNRKFDYLDIFFAGTDRIPIADDDFFKTYNAALSVYIRYLARNKEYSLVGDFVRILSLSSKRELHWGGIIVEFCRGMPLSVWKEVFTTTLQKVMQKLYPKSFKIIYEFVRFGLDSANVTIKSFELQRLSLKDEPGLEILVDRVRSHYETKE